LDDDLNSLALDAALTLDARAELQVRAGVMGYAAADRKWRARNDEAIRVRLGTITR